MWQELINSGILGWLGLALIVAILLRLLALDTYFTQQEKEFMESQRKHSHSAEDNWIHY